MTNMLTLKPQHLQLLSLIINPSFISHHKHYHLHESHENHCHCNHSLCYHHSYCHYNLHHHDCIHLSMIDHCINRHHGYSLYYANTRLESKLNKTIVDDGRVQLQWNHKENGLLHNKGVIFSVLVNVFLFTRVMSN
ncbi:hypothetical protein AAZX31_U017300 [Glycine max]